MGRASIDPKRVKEGSIIALNKLADAVWYDVLKREGFVLTVREHGTNYAAQTIDVGFVEQIK